ncbi:hypothetical protein, partial [Ligilactobacillus sp.]|uniref:hypothetical protein n=1 Tax=Ligilactobacillus sp. TaxID=2767921 RepID=UPI002FE26587
MFNKNRAFEAFIASEALFLLLCKTLSKGSACLKRKYSADGVNRPFGFTPCLIGFRLTPSQSGSSSHSP